MIKTGNVILGHMASKHHTNTKQRMDLFTLFRHPRNTGASNFMNFWGWENHLAFLAIPSKAVDYYAATI